MTNQSLQMILLAALAVAMFHAIWTDWRERVIENWLNLGIAVAAPLFWWATGLSLWPGMAIQIGLALMTLVLFGALFAFGAMGGGDVKLLAALALWFPPFEFIKLIIIMSIIGGVLTLVMYIRHKLSKSSEKLEIPYGIAIAAACLWAMYERYLNHFG